MTGRGRHAVRKRRFRLGWLPVLVTFVGVLVLLAAGAAYAGYRYDRASSSRILPGVRIAGMDVGGLTRAQAVLKLSSLEASMLDRTIDVHVGKRTWTVTPRVLGTRLDVARAVDSALSYQESFGWPARVYHRLLHKPVTRDVEVSVSYDRSAVWKFANDVVTKTERPARDAKLDCQDGKLVVVHSKQGATVGQTRLRDAVLRALKRERSTVDVRVIPAVPSATQSDLGKTIVIRTSTNKLYLYDGIKLVRT